MKTMKNLISNKIERFKESEADRKVKEGTHCFVPRKIWKDQVRDKK